MSAIKERAPPKILPRPNISVSKPLPGPVSFRKPQKEDPVTKASEILNLAPPPPESYPPDPNLIKFKSEWDKIKERNNDERFFKIFLSHMASITSDSFKRIYENEEEYPRALIIINYFFGKYDIKFKNIQEAIKIISKTFKNSPPEIKQSFTDQQAYIDGDIFKELVRLLKNEIKPPPVI